MKPSWRILGGVGLLVGAFLFGLGVGRLRQPDDAPSTQPATQPSGRQGLSREALEASQREVLVGRPAPAFDVRDLEGRRWTLSDLKGKVVVLNFWATWCVPCKTEMPHFDALARRHRASGLVVLGLSTDPGPAEVRRFLREDVHVGYPIAMADPALQEVFGGVPALPTTFVIDRDGIVRRELLGYSTEQELRELLDSVL